MRRQPDSDRMKSLYEHTKPMLDDNCSQRSVPLSACCADDNVCKFLKIREAAVCTTSANLAVRGQRLRISMHNMPSSSAAPAPRRVATAAFSCAHGQDCSIAADTAILIFWLTCNSEEADIKQNCQT